MTGRRVTLDGLRDDPPELAASTAAADLAHAVSEDEVLDVVTGSVFSASGADGLLLGLVRAGRLRLVRWSGYTDAVLDLLRDVPLETETPMAATVARQQAMFLPEPQAYLDAFPQQAHLLHRTGKQAWAFLPLRAGGRAVGTWLLSWREPRGFGVQERTRLLTLAGVVSQALERARLREAEHRLSLALQRAIVPQPPPQLAGLATAAHYQPGSELVEVGGDWYDVLPRRDLPVAVVIGDVFGHDIEAAATMGGVRHAVRAYAAEGHGPQLVLARANQLLCDGPGLDLATCCYLEIDEVTGTAVLVSAGHPAPVLLREGRPAQLIEVDPGPPLGTQRDARYPERLVLLDPGDTLLLFTDGLVESPGRSVGEGLARLEQVAGAAPAGALQALIDDVLTAMGGGTASADDVALVAVRYTPVEPTRRRQWVRRRLADAADAPWAARRSLYDALQAWRLDGLPGLLDDAQLVVSELVTNAVLHTLGGAVLELEVVAERLRLCVTDSSERRPAVRDPDPEETGGRGMVLVSALAVAWGAEEHPRGKTVWAELALAR